MSGVGAQDAGGRLGWTIGRGTCIIADFDDFGLFFGPNQRNTSFFSIFHLICTYIPNIFADSNHISTYIL